MKTLSALCSGIAILAALSNAQDSRQREKASATVAAERTPSLTSGKQFQSRTPRYMIRPADVIDVTFYPATELNQTLTVQPDGFVSLREVGDLHVQGKTVPELKTAVTSAYKDILHDPVVTIVLKDYDKPRFTVSGEVGKPGTFELRADTTASEAVAIAGGINDRAKHSQVLLFRKMSDNWVEAKQLDLKKIYQGNWKEDVHLRQGDMLFIPRNRMSKIKPFLPTTSLGAYMSPGAL
ncbi:MAG: polysaccharide export protein [Bryobacterales bacterium]|nr:polysaccharide export protein [Bryobacterales bacterium]